MNVVIDIVLLSCTFATVYALTCTKCIELSADDPDFPIPSNPNAVTCSNNPTEIECPSGCMTLMMTMHFSRDSGPLALMQKMRDCGPPPDTNPPTGDLCVADQAIIDSFTANLPDPAARFPPESGLTYQNLDASICFCDSTDRCTPPSPGVESTTIPTTPTGAALSLVSSTALVLGSLLHIFLCGTI